MVVQNRTSRAFIQSLCRLVGAFLFLVLEGCAQNPVSGEHDFVMLSEDSEISIGRTNHPKIIAQYGRYEDEAVQAYVQSVGNRLAEVSHRNDLVYRFTVLDSPVINAFALPGGYIYITRGLMAYLNSEAELAAVLGHEIGHVTARHGVRQQSAAQAANLGYTIGAILFPELRAAVPQNIFNILGGALLSGYGREHELESDGLGAQYLARSGYDPKAMIDVIRILKDQETFAAAEAKKQGKEFKGYHGLFASHPDNDSRLHEVVAKANKYVTTQQSKRGRSDYLARINGLVFGDSEKQGISSDHHFYHLEMGFAVDFPVKWQINNNPDHLQAVAPQGEAFIEVRTGDINRKLSPKDFIKTRLKIDNLQAAQVLHANGLEGYTGTVERQNKLARISVIYLQDRAFVFFSGTKQNDQFKQFDKSFLATAESMRALRQDEIRFANAQKIEVVKVSQQDSYTSWARESPITNSPFQQLQLLNGHFPNERLQIDQQAKRVK